MNETFILLELDANGLCTGPRHIPAAERWSNGVARSLEGRIAQAHGVPPERWIAECGVTGMLYVDAPILASRPECFGCRVQSEKRPVASWQRYDNEDDRVEARRRTWRESKRRNRVAA
jgi:hypothetical protein